MGGESREWVREETDKDRRDERYRMRTEEGENKAREARVATCADCSGGGGEGDGRGGDGEGGDGSEGGGELRGSSDCNRGACAVRV
jgi:hypothetical protein